MKRKFKDWLKEHKYVYGAGLLIVSLCAVSFGFAKLNARGLTADDIVEPDSDNQENTDVFTTV